MSDGLIVNYTPKRTIQYAKEALEKAKELERIKIKKGYKSVISADRKTSLLIPPCKFNYYKELGFREMKK